ncbi:hypothetical protein BGX27_002787, partial [Mortierella sp. AM989]
MPLTASISGLDFFTYFLKCTDEIGPIWSISLPDAGRMITINSPEAVEHTLKTNFWSYEKGNLTRDTMHDLIGNESLEQT